MLLHNSYNAVVHINNPLLYTGTPVLHGLGNHFLYVAPVEAFNLKIKPFKIKSQPPTKQPKTCSEQIIGFHENCRAMEQAVDEILQDIQTQD